MCSDVPLADCHRAVLRERDILARAAEEVERALRYQRPLSLLLAVIDDKNEAVRERLKKGAACLVRTPDIVGYLCRNELLFVFPETDANARIPAERVLSAVRRVDPSVRGALVRCPANGSDLTTLIDEAKKATSGAVPGTLSELSDKVETLSFGEPAPLVIAADEKTKRLFVLIRNLAKSDLPVLILGETGVGKESAAAAIHFGSKYRDGPFVALNCAAVPTTLLESELFGHEKGAFSGATAAKQGLVEIADGGTLFLDEITEASAETQAKLLRLLETKRNRRIGATKETAVTLRLVSAANRRVEALLSDDGFRKDLYYRIGGARIEVPPLRERPGDILPMAELFLKEATEKEGLKTPKFSDDAKRFLESYPWPGNVRELRHAMGYLAAVSPGEVVAVRDFDFLNVGSFSVEISKEKARKPSDGLGTFSTLAEEVAALEKRRMEEALESTGGARAKAAALIGMPLRTFVAKSKRFGLGDRGRLDPSTEEI